MKARLLLFLLVPLAGMAGMRVVAPQRSQATSFPDPAAVALPPDLDRVLRAYEHAWTARDAEALASLFHPQGFVLSPGQAPVQGRAGIRARYAGAGGPLHLRALAWASADTVAFIIGTFGARPGEAAGKFVLALQRSSSTEPWLIAADMDNPNPPPGGRP